MFNLAKIRSKLREMVEETAKDVGRSLDKGEFSKKYIQERALFEQSIKTLGRNKAILDDAQKIAMGMLGRDIKDPSAILGKVDKWNYIREYHPRYYQAVIRQIEYFLADGGRKLQKMVPPIPQKPQAPAGGDAGGMPMASNKSQMTKEAQMYLYRTKASPHKLFGTFASDISSGKLQYLNEEGQPLILKLDSDGDVSLRKSSPTITEAEKINEVLPQKIIQTITEFLTGKIEDAEHVARATYLRIRMKRNYDLLPVSLALSGPAYLLKMKTLCYKEDDELLELRKSIGKVIYPLISRLKTAMSIDGLQAREIKSFLPCYCSENNLEPVKQEDYVDKHVDRNMHILKEDAETSADLKSLLLTLTHPESQHKEQAAKRICILVSKHPQLIKEFSRGDIEAIMKTSPDHGKKVSETFKLINADSADLMKAYYDGDEFDKRIVANLVVSLNMQEVARAMPEMCMLVNEVNLDLFDKLDPTDPTTIKILLKIKIYHINIPKAIYNRKVAEVLSLRRDEDLVRLALSDNPSLASFCIGLLAESGDLKQEDFIKSFDSSKNENAAIAAIAVMDYAPNLVPTFHSWFKVRPSTLAIVSCKMHALKYMKMNRITWDGKRLPNASEMFSLPENPMNLAVSLSNIEDTSAMLALLYACCKEFSEGREKCKPVILFLTKELKAKGQEEKAYLVTSNFGIELGPEEDILPDESPTPDRIMFYIQSGNVVAAAHLLNELYQRDEEAARMTLENLPKPKEATIFMELLPIELVTDVELPSWAKGILLKAVVLPNGFAVTGSHGVYDCYGIPFSCKYADVSSSAMNLLVGRVLT